MKQKAIASLPIFCKSEGEIFALASTSDGGTACWVWRDGSWISIYFVHVFRNGISLSPDELISLIGRKAVESLPGRRW
jgi:hypothetical protein